ncbi:MAG: hypothetical protein COV46_00820 [Deltaproteobacteria bacterium CG11_big_fil_rev_8_21_14_0_20_49_13]|nr:MAG: hypothetical protein COV46_00820 [Deltaproteobacteria bacterium CG11_big_fil_rev_8_21_14_0_20_49_13]
MKSKILIVLFATIFASQYAHALCLEHCSENAKTGRALEHRDFSYRDKSHNTGDVKNSVMGDVNIHVGHKKMDVKIDQGSGNNTVNASVSSTIILGDMKQ